MLLTIKQEGLVHQLLDVLVLLYYLQEEGFVEAFLDLRKSLAYVRGEKAIVDLLPGQVDLRELIPARVELLVV